MPLISQPGSDYQAAQVTLDAGHARDITLMLVDVHAVLDHLYLDGTRPQTTRPAGHYLRESSSPYALPALIEALGAVINMLSHAEREALHGIPPGPPACQPPDGDPAACSFSPWQPQAGPSQRRTTAPDRGIPTVLISDSAISRKEEVIRRVLAHHAEQTRQAAARRRRTSCSGTARRDRHAGPARPGHDDAADTAGDGAGAVPGTPGARFLAGDRRVPRAAGGPAGAGAVHRRQRLHREDPAARAGVPAGLAGGTAGHDVAGTLAGQRIRRGRDRMAGQAGDVAAGQGHDG